jgi:hypothetical protein
MAKRANSLYFINNTNTDGVDFFDCRDVEFYVKKSWTLAKYRKLEDNNGHGELGDYYKGNKTDLLKLFI